MRSNSIRQYFVIALLLSLAIAITIHFPVVLEYFFRDEGGRDRHRVPDEFYPPGRASYYNLYCCSPDVYIEFLYLKSGR